MSVVDALLSKVNLIELAGQYTELSPDANGSSRGICPIHHGSNPTSFCVLDNDHYFCFSCGSYGNAINFYAEVEGLPFYSAVEALAEKYNIDIHSDETYVKQRDIVKRNNANVMKYYGFRDRVSQHLIDKRGLSEAIIDEFRLGFDPKGDFLASKSKPETFFTGIVVPIQDVYGRCVGFGKRRSTNEKPTYRNSWDSPLFKKGELLFNLNRARKRIKKTGKLIVCEGYFDVISAHMQGLACCGYIGGTLTREQLRLLKEVQDLFPKVDIVICTDNPLIDETGANELPRIHAKIQKYAKGLNVQVPVLPMDCKDFNDCHVKGIVIGDLPLEYLEMAVLKVLLSQCAYERKEFDVATKFVKGIQSDLVKLDIAKFLAKRWDQRIEDVRKQLFVTISAEDEILGQLSSVSDCVDAYYEMLKHPGYTLGWPSIDASFGKLRKKKVFLIGAFSKVGKSEFIVDILLHSVLRLKLRCQVFSMEMEKEAFMQRVMCKLFGVTKDRLEEIMLSEDGASRILEIQEKLEEYIVIDDTNDLTLDDMKQRVLLTNKKVFDKPVDRVFVDYFQYIKGASGYDGISATAKAMKPFAKSLNVQLFMLSQFSRNGDQFSEPDISSFRGGNDMESSMDYGILLWRPALDKEMTDTEKSHLRYVTKVKLISRDGLLFNEIFDLHYNPVTTRLEEKPSEIA